jgi:hypothetical protein
MKTLRAILSDVLILVAIAVWVSLLEYWNVKAIWSFVSGALFVWFTNIYYARKARRQKLSKASQTYAEYIQRYHRYPWAYRPGQIIYPESTSMGDDEPTQRDGVHNEADGDEDLPGQDYHCSRFRRLPYSEQES